MLNHLLSIMLLSWLGLSLFSLLTPLAYGKVLLPWWRVANIVAAGLTLITGLSALISQLTIVQTLPWFFLPFHPSLRLDNLAAFFILLLGVASCGITCFGFGYFKHFTIAQQKQIQGWQALFIFAMLLVFVANDAITFLLAWEVMAVSSYFLIVNIEPSKTARKAGLLYLGMAHIGLFAIAGGLFLLATHAGADYSHFNQWSTLHGMANIANLIFILALLGFGAKAGLFPLHIWLPEAHPAAPSPISALMSGIMLKTAIYGLLRFIFGFLLAYQQLWWGYLLVTVGLLSMLIGVIHAALQTDMKRLLAYSSIENMGLITTAIGLAIIFYQYHELALTSVALIVVLLHCFNHGLFKSLLFLGTGSILHATGERNLGKLGGLIHKMPWVAACTLIGTLAMAGLPLFNGFISEWLYLSLFFQQNFFPHFNFAILSPLIVAMSMLVFGLAGYVIVKFFGIAFLGQPRESALTHAHPASWFEHLGLSWLALGCVVLGLWPQAMIHLIQSINSVMVTGLASTIQTHHRWDFTLTLSERTPMQLSPLLLGIGIIVALICIAGLVKWFSRFTVRRGAVWDCGYRWLTPRMQDTAEGFGQPLEQVFLGMIDRKLILPRAEDANPYYRAQLSEKIWRFFYYPLAGGALQLAAFTKRLQQGKITNYLLYIAITLLILLTWVVWS